VDRAKRIGNVSDSDDLCARANQFLELVQQQLALIVDRDDAQLRALLLAQNLPGNDVRVVLHRADEHLVACTDVCASVGLSYEIDSLGCSTDENQFFHSRSIDELPRRFPCRFMLSGCVLRKKVNAAMN